MLRIYNGKEMKRLNILLLLTLVYVFVIYGAAYASQVTPRIVEYRGAANAAVFQDGELRESTILTTSYVATDFARLSKAQDLGLWFVIEQGSLTSFEYKIQWSRDGRIWFDEVTETIIAGKITDTILYYTITLGGDIRFYKPLPFRAQYIRAVVKGTGTVTSSTCTVYITGVND